MDVIVPIIEDRRIHERRADWHTPEDCAKLISVRLEVSKIGQQLEAGNLRMNSIERTMAENSRASSADREAIKQSLMLNSIKAAADRELILKQQQDLRDEWREPMEVLANLKGFAHGVIVTGKWTRRIIMWVFPAATAVVSFAYAVSQLLQ